MSVYHDEIHAKGTLTRHQQGARSRSESLFVITNWSQVFLAIMTSASKNI